MPTPGSTTFPTPAPCGVAEHHFQRPRYWIEFLKTTVHTEVKLYTLRSDSPLAHYFEGNETFEHHFQRPRYWIEFLKTTVHTEVKLYTLRSDSPLAHYSEGNKTFVFILMKFVWKICFDEICLKNLARQLQSATIHPPPPHTGGC
ncbi:hypothetical protein GBA52_024601 [Prunus armeniaca]|nr:hypothetical protein GBA52_024577 [Prunus armeniaca]KAH0972445.1 hypothetical protein GBA52_024601 [Prunus armeniaca]